LTLLREGRSHSDESEAESEQCFHIRAVFLPAESDIFPNELTISRAKVFTFVSFDVSLIANRRINESNYLRREDVTQAYEFVHYAPVSVPLRFNPAG
jgi:hypothetical protein